jgi:hypothetical protein
LVVVVVVVAVVVVVVVVVSFSFVLCCLVLFFVIHDLDPSVADPLDPSACAWNPEGTLFAIASSLVLYIFDVTGRLLLKVLPISLGIDGRVVKILWRRQRKIKRWYNS